MATATNTAVTILIPHFQTPDSIKLCLRSLRKFTAQSLTVRILDNGSRDASLDYLRSVKWIELIETGVANHIWSAHYSALNAAVPLVTTPYFLLMHSDTYVHHPQWLEFLLARARAGCVAVGPRHQRVPVRTLGWLPKALVQHLRIRERAPGVPELRSFCALYETATFRQLGCQFSTADSLDITCAVNEQLVRAGHRICGLSAFALSPYLFHASAVTLMAQGIQPVAREEIKDACARGTSYLDHRTYRRSNNCLQKFLQLPSTRAILADDTLDA
ncbi:MAG: glycosyltransferase family A protein [Kiritimatiellaeota bacterium]|nr:glycosyltransferase family A protein [Kiritimatiellota bacterium]